MLNIIFLYNRHMRFICQKKNAVKIKYNYDTTKNTTVFLRDDAPRRLKRMSTEVAEVGHCIIVVVNAFRCRGPVPRKNSIREGQKRKRSRRVRMLRRRRLRNLASLRVRRKRLRSRRLSRGLRLLLRRLKMRKMSRSQRFRSRKML